MTDATPPRSAAGPTKDQMPATSFRDRWLALRNIGPFLVMVWNASPGLTLATLFLRLARAVLPVTALWFGKLIIDEVVRLTGLTPRPDTLQGWWQSGETAHLTLLVMAEFGFAILSDLLARAISLVDALLAERLTMASSLRLMEHAATLDLEDFEDAGFQDALNAPADRRRGGCR